MKAKIILIIITIIFFSYLGNKGINYLRNKQTIEKAVILITEIDNFKMNHGTYPQSINTVVPKFIPKCPIPTKTLHYQIHGKHYLLSFNHDNNIFFSNRTYVYWSKTKEWYLSGFTEWPEE